MEREREKDVRVTASTLALKSE